MHLLYVTSPCNHWDNFTIVAVLQQYILSLHDQFLKQIIMSMWHTRYTNVRLFDEPSSKRKVGKSLQTVDKSQCTNSSIIWRFKLRIIISGQVYREAIYSVTTEMRQYYTTLLSLYYRSVLIMINASALTVLLHYIHCSVRQASHIWYNIIPRYPVWS